MSSANANKLSIDALAQIIKQANTTVAPATEGEQGAAMTAIVTSQNPNTPDNPPKPPSLDQTTQTTGGADPDKGVAGDEPVTKVTVGSKTASLVEFLGPAEDAGAIMDAMLQTSKRLKSASVADAETLKRLSQKSAAVDSEAGSVTQQLAGAQAGQNAAAATVEGWLKQAGVQDPGEYMKFASQVIQPTHEKGFADGVALADMLQGMKVANQEAEMAALAEDPAALAAAAGPEGAGGGEEALLMKLEALAQSEGMTLDELIALIGQAGDTDAGGAIAPPTEISPEEAAAMAAAEGEKAAAWKFMGELARKNDAEKRASLTARAQSDPAFAQQLALEFLRQDAHEGQVA
jgi:hypothetical protein